MKFYLGVTDNAWYNYLSNINPEDINFWQPGGNTTFRLLLPGAPFVFKLKSPLNAIGGVGFFSSHTFLPMSIAWETFGERNGCSNYGDFKRMILQYRGDKYNVNPQIGCIVLTNPIFFKKEDWIQLPANWSNSIVQGKTYNTAEEIDAQLWAKIETLLQRYLAPNYLDGDKSQLILEEPDAAYGKSILSKVRLGQGAFRVMITDAYNRKCSISGEKTLPVLEAAHIKPYALSGPNFISNGLLLRSDIHKLFDAGYITITKALKVEISKRIKEEFENGKEYYQYHGKELQNLPLKVLDKPHETFIKWHNENRFEKN